jgi:oligosaccharide repeat unit polymerase
LVCALVVIWPILRAFGSGGRTPLITSVGALLAVLYWKAKPAARKKMILAVLVCAPLIYSVMAALVISRTAGAFSWEDRERARYVGNEMFRELVFITSKLSSGDVDFQYGYLYYVQLVNPIPRFLWPSKPTLDAGILMANVYGEVNAQGEANLTISPGLIGEMYLNFGFIGVLGLSAFGGWLVKGWDQIPRFFAHSLPAMVYYSAGLAVLFIMGRSFTMGMFYGLLSLGFLAWWIRYCNPNAVTHAQSGPALVERSG